MENLFRNRDEAAIELSGLLTEYKDCNGVVLAIPRGGIPIGHTISKILHLPLDIALSKKIGHPLQKEFAIGAVSLSESIVDTADDVSSEYIEKETQRIRAGLIELYKLFKGNAEPVEIKNKIVIITDDGIATGRTMIATLNMLKKQNPSEIVIAIPVISPSAYELLLPQTDKIITLAKPTGFRAIGQFYGDFSQVTNEEILKLLSSG